ncbi:MAG: molybdopterin dinucleotide binding domain-containing protein, partial [Nitrospirota bacterium]
ADMGDVYDRIVIGGKQYQYPKGRANLARMLGAEFPADRAAIDRYLSQGFERDLAGRYQMPRTPSRPDGTVQIELVQSLFHSGKLSTKSKGLIQIEDRSSLRISPHDAARFALVDGNRVRLSNSQGEVTAEVKVVERVPEGHAWFPDHFSQEVNRLFACVMDAETKVPYIRTTSASMVKVS